MANIIDNLNVLNTNLDNAKFKLAKNLKNKGVQALPSDKLDVLADKIVDIPSGSCNLQELDVNENGVYTPQAGDVKGYSKVTVNVPQSGGGTDQWKEIGYNAQPKYITDAVNYAKQIFDTWNPNQTTLQNKFFKDSNLIFMPLVDTSKVTNMNSMFGSCESLTTIPQLDTSKVTNAHGMFYSCKSLTTIPQLDTNNVTDMSGMFQYCKSLTTIPQFNTSKVTDMNNMFYSCESLTTIPQLDTNNVTNMTYMFNGCKSLTTIPQLDTSKVTNMSSMFDSCESLTTIPQLDISNVSNISSIFYSCNKIRYIKFIGLGTNSKLTSFDLKGSSWGPNKFIGIDGDGVVGCRQALIDTLITDSFDRATAGYPTCTITMAEETKALLTEDEKAAITAKGYTLA